MNFFLIINIWINMSHVSWKIQIEKELRKCKAKGIFLGNNNEDKAAKEFLP